VSDMLKRELQMIFPVCTLMLAMNAAAALVDGEELIDPTAPFLLEMESAGGQPVANVFARFNNYDVSSILIRENLRIAVINSQRVREGELIGSARVVSIEEGEVTIDLDGQTRVLSLHGGTSIKSRASEQN